MVFMNYLNNISKFFYHTANTTQIDTECIFNYALNEHSMLYTCTIVDLSRILMDSYS